MLWWIPHKPELPAKKRRQRTECSIFPPLLRQPGFLRRREDAAGPAATVRSAGEGNRQPINCLLAPVLHGHCLVRLEEEDVRALKRARADGLSASDLLRKGLRMVASRCYSGRRPPSILLFESTNAKPGDESELFRDLGV